MAKFVLLNSVRAGTSSFRAGLVFDDSVEAAEIALIQLAQGRLAPVPDAELDGAVTRAAVLLANGASEIELNSLMLAARATQSSPLADGSVTTPKIADAAVTADKLADESVVEAKLADAAVTNAKLADDSVTTPKIEDGSVTPSKLGGDLMQSYILGSSEGGTVALLPAVDFDRPVIIVVQVIETFADNSGTQQAFQIGETGDSDKFAPASEFTNAIAGLKCVTYTGFIVAGAALTITAAQATGDGTGALQVAAVASRNT